MTTRPRRPGCTCRCQMVESPERSRRPHTPRGIGLFLLPMLCRKHFQCPCRYPCRKLRFPSRCSWIGCNPHPANSTRAQHIRVATSPRCTISRYHTLLCQCCNSDRAPAHDFPVPRQPSVEPSLHRRHRPRRDECSKPQALQAAARLHSSPRRCQAYEAQQQHCSQRTTGRCAEEAR